MPQGVHLRPPVVWVVVGVLSVGLGCAGGRKPAEAPRGPDADVETPRPGEPDVLEPFLPDLGPEQRTLRAGGASSAGAVQAERAARTALAEVLSWAIEPAAANAWPLHPYFAYDGEFVDEVTAALDSTGDVLTFLLDRVDVTARRGGDRYEAIATLDRAAAARSMAERAEREADRVTEAVDVAREALDGESWFGFVRWSRTALRREARRVAFRIALDAIGIADEDGPRERALSRHDHSPGLAYDGTDRLVGLGAMVDSLFANHGWTLRIEFDWQDPPPRQIEPRLKGRLVQALRTRGVRVGLGVGCPTAVPPEEMEDPGAEDEPPPPEPAPHHVLRIDARGSTERTALASWDARIALSIEARTCEVGTMVSPREIGGLVGRNGRDQSAAYFRSLDWKQLEEILYDAFRDVDLMPPDEIGREPPGAAIETWQG